MKIVDCTKEPWNPHNLSVRPGSAFFMLLGRGELGPGVNYRANLWKYGAGDDAFTTPRHRHDFEQIRFALKGSQTFGPDLTLQEGWVGYFPAGAFYGPQNKDGAEDLIIQWSETYLSEKQHSDARAELAERGEFHDGIYTTTDASGKKRNKDAVQAMWEHAHGRKMTYPVPRYSRPILMNPDVFAWKDAGSNTLIKSLGHFTEDDLFFEMVRWKDGGRFVLTDERTHLLFTLGGRFCLSGELIDAHTAVWSELGESIALEGDEGAEALCIGFPVVDGAATKKLTA